MIFLYFLSKIWQCACSVARMSLSEGRRYKKTDYRWCYHFQITGQVTMTYFKCLWKNNKKRYCSLFFQNAQKTVWSKIKMISDSLFYRNIFTVTTPIIFYSKIRFFLHLTPLRRNFFSYILPRN